MVSITDKCTHFIELLFPFFKIFYTLIVHNVINFVFSIRKQPYREAINFVSYIHVGESGTKRNEILQVSPKVCILQIWLFLVVFSFFFEKIPIVVVRDVCPSVRPSVEIISFHGILISNWPIDLKMSMNVLKGVVHVRKA